MLSMNTNLIVMCGVPGSGKSFASEIWKEKSKNNCKIFSSDKYRELLLGDEKCQDNNELVFNTMYRDLVEHLKNGYDAILDATNTTLKSRLKIIDLLKKNDLFNKVNKFCYIVNTPWEECLLRDCHRDRTVGHNVIDKFIKNFQCPQYFEGWDLITFDYFPESGDESHLNSRLNKMKDFNQENPHHIYSLGEHCNRVKDYYISYNNVRAKAGLLHDIGKLFTKHFDEYGIAHYYNHDSVGAYFITSHLDLLTTEEERDNALDIIFYVNYHMRAHKDFRTTKAYKKYSQIFGQMRLDNLIEFADADIVASGTKDCHDEVMKKIEELKGKNINGSKN